MSGLRDFLNWFEGKSEDIEDAPTAKQWARIKEKLLALKAEVDANGDPVQAAPPVSTEPIGGAHTTEWWKKQVAIALEEEGYDPASAQDVLSTIPVDLNADPAAVAKRAAQGM
jgi:hypothetical protein